ncbi:MAG: CRISPR-associated protein Csx15 [Anaerolineales bacterium]|nr:CRISPR-associated protein Csx15 [Anaerolineales bacterium]MCS7247265.1 CRISPR-associated protein Csx15 [Anaerolineales bacterium]MDW8161076.1 CRISPR-associated protein Csx15 [Anaerolineales bacterium]MDW8447542.1 CRISPR-associated protein Csx15 [Anaerolineales bacterium]
MMILNFSHPLTEQQLDQIRQMVGEPIEQVIFLPVHFDNGQPFLPQLEALMANIPFQGDEWQNLSILVNPPSLNFITALLLAELHGRMGYFPPILRLRPVEGALPPRYEVAEILNLQQVRESARKHRYEANR